MKNILLFFAFLPILLMGQKPIYQEIQKENIDDFPSVRLFERPLLSGESINKTLPDLQSGVLLELQEANIATLLDHPTQNIRITLPFPDGNNQEIILIPASSISTDLTIKAASSRKSVSSNNKSHHYWGIVADQPESAVAISIFEDQIMGMILLETGTYLLGPLENSSDNTHVLYKEQDLDAVHNFSCHVEELPEENITPTNKSVLAPNPERCVLMYVEVDNDIFVDKGSMANTTNYITGLFNQVSLMYFNEVIKLRLHELLIWDTADPYNGTSTSDYLSDFQNQIGVAFNGDIAHLVGYEGGGGLAQLNVLCHPSRRHAYSDINSTFNAIPVYSWSVNVLTHEIGHNLGSRHTHDCAWNGNDTPIDRCGIDEGYGTGDSCENGATLPVAGTVMSYCHLVSGIGIDFNLGFGPQPGDYIRDKVYNASCLTPCDPSDEICDDDFDNDFDGLTDCEDPDCEEYISCLPCLDHIITLTLILDQYSSETSWTLTDDTGAIIEESNGYGGQPEGTVITEEFCLADDCYQFTIFDTQNDGICCNYGEGSYTLSTPDGTVLATGGQFGSDETVMLCEGAVPEICDDGIDNDNDGLIDCEDPDCSENEVCQPCEGNTVILQINYDSYPLETSWAIKDMNANIVASGSTPEDTPAFGALNLTYCLDDGCYTFQMYDSEGDGLCCNFGGGSYELSNTFGEILASGGEFGEEDNTLFCIEDTACPIGNVYTVTNTNDNGLGSLQQAIRCCNAIGALDTIIFDLGPTDTIFVDESLPSITDDEIYINGDGNTVLYYTGTSRLLTIDADYVKLDNLQFSSPFDGSGTAIFSHQNSTGTVITTCYFEEYDRSIHLRGRNNLIEDNTFFVPDFEEGVFVDDAAKQTILRSNTISSPLNGYAFNLRGDSIQISDNTMYDLRAGVYSVHSNRVDIKNNTFYNNRWGIFIIGEASYGQEHLISQNSLYCNTDDNGIQLSNLANNLQAAPLITNITANTVEGTAASGDIVEVFLSDNTDCPDAPCQGKTYVGTAFTDADGNWQLSNIELDPNVFISTTATDENNNSSSFSDCLQFTAPCVTANMHLMTNTLMTCPEDSVLLYLVSDVEIEEGLNITYSVNGEMVELSDFTLTDTLRLSLSENTTFQLLSASNNFDCGFIVSDDLIEVLVADTENLSSSYSTTLCSGDTLFLQNQTVVEAGVYTEAYESSFDCDSIVTITVELLPSPQTSESLQICEGQSIEIFGEMVSIEGEYQAVFPSQFDCDSTHTVQLEVLPTIQTAETLQLCEGQSIEVFGDEITEAGVYSSTFTATNDCDSTHQITVEIIDIIYTFATETVCEGESIEVFGEQITEGGQYEASFDAQSGCDSIHQIEVVLLDNVQSMEQLSICDGESIEIFGENVSETGEYSANFMAENGCDSTHTINLEVVTMIETFETLQSCEGQTVMVFEESYTSDAVASSTFTSVAGCDSTHQVTIVFEDEISTQESLNICEGESIDIFGEMVSTAGEYQESFTSQFGCDSIHTIQLEVLSPVETFETLQLCEGQSITVFDDEITEAGVYSSTFTSINDCDSIHQITVEIIEIIFTFATETVCEGESIEVFGEQITEGGQYQASFGAQSGCDSIHQIEVVLLNNAQGMEELSICQGESIEIFGENVSEAGDYAANFTAANGCDSTHTIHLTVSSPVETFETLQTCTGQTVMVFEESYTSDAVASATFTSISGCDSTHQVTIVFEDEITTQASLTICDGEMIDIFGEMTGEAGTYSDEFNSSLGCDSIHTIELIVLETVNTFEELTTCEGESIMVFGEPQSIAGFYSEQFTASNSCDSIHQIELVVLENSESFNTVTICDGEMVEIFGILQSEAGLYTQNNTAANGCDSIASIQLILGETPEIEVITNATCSDETSGSIELIPLSGNTPFDYQWAHTAENTATLNDLEEGIYEVTITDVNGCHHNQTIEIEAFPSLNYTLEYNSSACLGDNNGYIFIDSSEPNVEISFEGQPFGSMMFFNDLPPGNYHLEIRNESGCISVENVVLDDPHIFSVSEIEIVQPSCDDDQNGSINVLLVDDSPGFDLLHFEWNTGQTGPMIEDLGIGTYEVTITEIAAGCIIYDTVILESLSSIESNLQIQLGCGNEQILASTQPTFGQAPYTVEWSNNQSGLIASSLAAGNYTLSITDANNCLLEEDFNIPFIAPFNVTYSVEDVSCFEMEDGAINLNIIGGIPPYDIIWDNGETSENLENLAFGSYLFNVTSASCNFAAEVQINSPLSVSAQVYFSPFDGDLLQVTAIAEGGTPPYSYSWSNGQSSPNATSLTVGQTINLLITDSNGCQFEESYVVLLTDIAYLEEETLFNIFPNPTFDQIFIESISGLSLHYDLQLYNTAGALVQTLSDQQLDRQALSLGNLPAGVYLLVIRSGAFSQVKRIVKL